MSTSKPQQPGTARQAPGPLQTGTERDARGVPTPGPIAVLPESSEALTDVVRMAGGTVEQLSAETRGIMWVSANRADELADILEAYPGVEWVQLPWAGVDAFSELFASYASMDRPLWTSAKGSYAQPVAEHALTLMLALLRVLPYRIRATTWSNVKAGRSLYGRHVVIVGAGGIAVELARLLQPFGVRLTVVRRREEDFAGADRTVTVDRLHEVLPDADVLVIAAALTAATRSLIGTEELRLLPASAVLINIARGGLIDTDALVDAVRDGHIAGAGLDVTDPEPLPDGHPLWAEGRVIITPHSADTPEMTAPLLAERLGANVSAFLGRGDFIGVVDTEAGY